MTEHNGTTTNNTAEHGSTVGIQGGHVHDNTVYQVFPEDPPAKKYEVGVRFLEDGVPSRARDLIGEAIAHDYDSGEVQFHWALAMLSKRSYRDLTSEEREQLGRISEILHKYPDDEWKRALHVICGLLAGPNDSEADSGPVFKELDSLQPRQRDKIVHHLDLILTGRQKDNLWDERRQAAKDGRYGGNRRSRVWAYFEPDPIGPRARSPVVETTTLGDWLQAVTCSGLFAVAMGYLGWLVLAHAGPLPQLAYLLALAAGYVAARHGLEWGYRSKRLRVKEREYFGQRRANRAPEGGFANQVDRSFTHYFTKYVPQGTDREAWLAHTAGIRKTLRDEIVDLYRESRTSVKRVNWLIRHMVGDVRQRWEAGTLLEYRERYRITVSTKLWCSIALAVLIPAGLEVIIAAVGTAPFIAVTATLVALACGKVAATRWLHIISERRRYAEDSREHKYLLRKRQTAYQKWADKLDSKRPSEGEMETWLEHDKTMFADAALRRYGLAWRDITAHTFLQTPAEPCKGARVSGGPWRYSKYDVRLFLITQDGVREVSRELDFEQGLFSGQERNNFRFDAVSSVHVSETNNYRYTLELTLTNGPTRYIRVTDPETLEPGSDENPATLSEINLDMAGFAHTLHILEGIAAEGKCWFDRDSRTDGDTNQSPPSTTNGL